MLPLTSPRAEEPVARSTGDAKEEKSEHGSDTVIITAKEINALQAHTMADILNTVPGVSAGTSSVTIHGNYKVKVFLDGRPLNDPTSSIGAVNWDVISPDEVERIEILRGKGGIRYGQNASGGVVLISSKKSRKIAGSVKTFGGNHDRYCAQSNVQVTSGAYTITARGGYDTTNGYKINNDKKRYTAGASMAYTFPSQARISLSADYTDDERGSSGYPDNPTPYSRVATTMQAYAIQGELNQFKAKAWLNAGDKHNSDVSRDLDKTIAVDNGGVEVSHSKATQGIGEFSYGAAFYLNRAEGSDFSDQDENTTSLFLIDSYSLTSIPMEITAGLRANFNSAFDDAFNPELKLSYSGSGWRAALGYNRTNNTPSFYQRYNETATTRPNPDLDMEVADNFSLAWFYTASEIFNASVTLFYNRLTDRITYTWADNGTASYRNVGSAAYTGTDLSLTWKPLETLQLKLNYVYLEAKDEDTDLDLPAKPNHKGRLDITWSPLKPFSLIGTARGTSHAWRNRANTTRLAGYVIYDTRLEYRFKHVDLFAEVSNIFDREYLYVDGLLAPSRTWFAGIKMRL